MSIKLALTKLIPDKIYLQLLYYKHFKKFIDFKNPKTFNEKLQWLKLYDRKPEYTTMVDKYAVKKYVADIIGEEYIIPTLGVWDSPEDIDFDALPNQFVLKWNHDSGSIVICKDKSQLNREEALKKLQKGKKYSGFWYGREWPYKNVEKKLIAEKFMVDEQNSEGLIDYKFYCFNGNPEFLYVSKGLENHATASISFLTTDWQFAPWRRDDFKPFDELPQKPKEFDKMVELCKMLSAGNPFLRVDLYEVNGKVYFSELTFSPCAGLMPFNPKEWDYILGDCLKISDL